MCQPRKKLLKINEDISDITSQCVKGTVVNWTRPSTDGNYVYSPCKQEPEPTAEDQLFSFLIYSKLIH